jgi:hypothetical protein
VADRNTRRLRRLASAARREASLVRAAVRAYNRLLAAIEPLLAGSSYDAGVLDDRLPEWRAAVDEELVPEVTATYEAALLEDARKGVTLDARAYATAYLHTVHNRLVGVADYVFDQVAATLAEGNLAGESIPELAARVDVLFTDAQRWKNRATVVARTEVIGANNAGHADAAKATADMLAVPHTLVAKEWLATHDTRTRPHHREADGQQVMGLASRFTVGDAELLQPGDVTGPGDEVIQCRCSALYFMPGDPGYPDALAAAGGTMNPTRALHRQHAIVAAGSPCDEHPCVCTGCDEFDCALDACACCWTYRDGVLVLTPEHPNPDLVEALSASLAASGRSAQFDVSRMPPKLQAYWNGPEGRAKIGWGSGGDFKRCQAALSPYVPARMIDGTCANLHKEATGEWPGPHAHGATVHGEAFASDTSSGFVEPPPGRTLPAGVEPYEPEDADPNTGLWIGFLPAADEEVHGIGPEEKHCTAFFLGDASQFTDQDHTDLAALLQTWAATQPPEDAAVTGMDRLGRDDSGKALVWLLDDTLAGPREALASTPLLARLLKVAADLQFPTYLPHVTVGYPDDQTDDTPDSAWPAIEASAKDVTSVRFDRVAMWWGDDQSAEWPLTGGPDTPPASTEPADGAESPTEEAPVTAAATEPAVQTDAQTGGDLTWTGILCPEGVVTGDKRKFADGAISWMNSPVVLKAMFADAPGHDGSIPVGLILGIERVDGKLVAHGTWDTGPNAVEARRQNIAGLMRGVSVDLDSIEMHLEDDQGAALEGDMIWDLEVEPTLVVDSGRIRAATLWCTPAYVEAYVLDATVSDQVPDTGIADSGTGTAPSPLGLAASATYRETLEPAVARPEAAPSAAFANPGLTEPTCLTVTDDGRVFGHLAVWGTCHIGIEGACVTPPQSNAGYAYFATGMYATRDGDVLPVGTITMGTGHADLNLGWRPTVDHYDDTGTAAAYISIGEDEVGIWFAGALDEHLPDAQRAALARTGSVSGDWRGIAGNLELVAALAVNVPGFPIPRVQSRVASLAAAGGRVQPTALVASGIVSHLDSTPHREEFDYARLAREVTAYQARQARLDATRRSLRKRRQQKLAGQIRKV